MPVFTNDRPGSRGLVAGSFPVSLAAVDSNRTDDVAAWDTEQQCLCVQFRDAAGRVGHRDPNLDSR